MDKIPVRFGESTFFLSACKNGCPDKELVVMPEDDKGSTVGCNFCGEFEDSETLMGALLKWENHQKKKTQ